MYMFIVLSLSLLCGFLLFRIALLFAKRKMRVRSLTKNFYQKVYMTAGLGMFFCGFYLSVVWILSKWVQMKGRLSCFLFLQEHLVGCIYFGLAFFVAISLTILLIRSFIKARYNSRRALPTAAKGFVERN